jgi:hypothetical protein
MGILTHIRQLLQEHLTTKSYFTPAVPDDVAKSACVVVQDLLVDLHALSGYSNLMSSREICYHLLRRLCTDKRPWNVKAWILCVDQVRYTELQKNRNKVTSKTGDKDDNKEEQEKKKDQDDEPQPYHADSTFTHDGTCVCVCVCVCSVRKLVSLSLSLFVF